MSGELSGALTALATCVLVVVTIAAVVVGGLAARAANRTFRLEAEAKLVLRVVGEANIFARQRVLYRLNPDWVPGNPPTADQISPLDEAPVHLVSGRANEQGEHIVAAGFTIRDLTQLERNRLAQSPVWPALRVEIRNVGRSPAVEAQVRWLISALMFAPGWRESFAEDGPQTEEKTDEGYFIVDGIGPNDSAFVWLGNATGTHFTLSLQSPGTQRDPLHLESPLRKPLSMITTSMLRLGTCSYNV